MLAMLSQPPRQEAGGRSFILRQHKTNYQNINITVINKLRFLFCKKSNEKLLDRPDMYSKSKAINNLQVLESDYNVPPCRT